MKAPILLLGIGAAALLLVSRRSSAASSPITTTVDIDEDSGSTISLAVGGVLNFIAPAGAGDFAMQAGSFGATGLASPLQPSPELQPSGQVSFIASAPGTGVVVAHWTDSEGAKGASWNVVVQ